jgi:hypothetical protein
VLYRTGLAPEVKALELSFRAIRKCGESAAWCIEHLILPRCRVAGSTFYFRTPSAGAAGAPMPIY